MRMSEIVRIDARGRMTLPSTLREAIGLSQGMYVMLIADVTEKHVRIIPFADPKAKLMEFHIILHDVPEALANVASMLAENNVDLLLTTSRTLKRGELAEWVVTADVSKCNCQLKKLKEKILNGKLAKKSKLKKYTLKG
jgi:AbrB family looped-hinge helix DNA binding protein